MKRIEFTYNRTKKKSFFYANFLFGFFIFLTAVSQEKESKNLNFEDSDFIKFSQIKKDLSEQYISSIIQGKNDFLWIGTQDGLYRFDGSNTKTYKYNPITESLPGTWIRTIVQDDNGVFWLGINGFGLVRFDSHKNEYEILSTELESSKETSGLTVLQVLCTKEGAIWIRTENGVFKKEKEDEKFIKITSANSTININKTVNGNVLISKEKALFHYQTDTNELVSILENVSIQQFESTIKDQIIYRSKGDLFIHDLKNKSSKKIPLPKKISNISNIQKQTIYFLGENKLFRYNIETESIVPLNIDDQSLKIKDIKTLFIDNSDVLWVGSRKGLYKQNVIADIFKETIPLHGRGIIVDDKYVFIAGRNGFHKYNKETKVITPIIKNTYFLSIHKTLKGFWLGDIRGNIHFVDQNGKISVFDAIIEKTNNPIRDIYGIVEDANGHIWIGSWIGLYLLNEKGELIKTFAVKTKDENKGINITKLYIDKKGTLWITTVGNGVYRIPEASKISAGVKDFNYTNYLHEKGNVSTINSNVLYEIKEEKNGTLWFGTNYGINQYVEETNSFKPLKKDKKLFDDNSMSFQIDKENLFWISTIRNGIFILNPVTKQYFNLNKKDGLVSNAYLFNSSAHYDNKLYFGTEDKVQVINTKNFIYPKIEKSPLITDFNIYGQDEVPSVSTLKNQELILEHHESNFTIRFQLLDFRFSDKVNYFYKIKEIQQDWRKTKDNNANFTNLQPGTYHFLLRATYQSKLPKNAPETSMTIIIMPPWYKTWWAYTFYSIAFLSIIMLLYKFNLNRKIAVVEKQKTLELDSLKTEMYENISHEFRTPLTLINGLSQVLLEEDFNHENIEKLKGINNNGNQLLHLVNQMLELVSFEANEVIVSYKNADIIKFISQCVSLYRFYADSKEIQLIFTSEASSLIMDFDDKKLQKILNNVLSNAIKFTQKGGAVNVEISAEGQDLLLTIRDTGQGIAPEHIPHIFERHYKTFDVDNTLGNGIGMALTKELVTILEGSISVKSVLEKGSVFTIKLPIKNTIKNSEAVIHHIPFIETIKAETEIIENYSATATILLVEDNKEIQKFIKLLLGKLYTIHIANNGVEGLEIAKNKPVDFIISDVMMPKMNGFEFCKHIKEDTKTSHIPFIMVTAKSATQDKLEGYRLGVDAYLLKPFNKEELLLIIKNLLQKQQDKIKYFSTLLNLKKQTTAVADINQLDIDFIKAIQEIALLPNKVTIDEITEKLFISRSQLHKKIKALTGKSITHYLNYVRIEKAKQLLKDNTLQIGEIAFELGFESANYFTRIFKKETGITPVEYRETRVL
ncbi:Signal transduction histidine kinase [Aquimarina amphilecti]|uniref:histidine kinase n=1 Tax=Aquimarina amphilecti TaxID=1038014 RepID=A0A1H7TPL8_AQUAM|nr:response regulator [Aquimarina amphilecti]SEL86800.1 Signal transduction histidine kinase [Aquimarina amphilecti]